MTEYREEKKRERVVDIIGVHQENININIYLLKYGRNRRQRKTIILSQQANELGIEESTCFFVCD